MVCLRFIQRHLKSYLSDVEEISTMDSLGKETMILFAVCLTAFWSAQAGGFEIITTDLPDAIVEYSYSTNLEASTGVPPYAWSVVSGALPPGLSLGNEGPPDYMLGIISGTPTTVGVYAFTVEVQDSTQPVPQSDEKQFSIEVLAWQPRFKGMERDASSNIQVEWWSKTDDTYAVESSFGPYDTEGSMLWTVEATDIASGGASTSWTDTDPGTPTGEKYYRVYVEPQIEELRIIGEYGDGEYFEDYYDDSVTAEGGVPPYTWEIISGYLPIDLELDPNTGVISGIPLLTGQFDFEIRVTDSASPANHATKEFSIYIY
jgi:hypothetical protein